MKYLKSYNELITEGKDKSKKKSKEKKDKSEDGKKPVKNKLVEKVTERCKKLGLTNFEVSDDGTVNVYDNVYIQGDDRKSQIKDGKLKIKFGVVTGSFRLGNVKIESLEGCPHTVHGNFALNDTQGIKNLIGMPQDLRGDLSLYRLNDLTSLEGAPDKIGRQFYLASCYKISSLEGIPQNIGTDVVIQSTSLKDLKGSPETINGNFHIHSCKLRNLLGGPKFVGESFSCSHNRIENLIGGPISVGGSYECQGNVLTSLEGAPQIVGGSFDTEDNRLENLLGFPEDVGSLYLSHNPLTSLEGFPKVVRGDVIFGECENLYDPKGMRDSQIDGDIDMQPSTPIWELWEFFGNSDGRGDYIEMFLDSLDYNYLREIDGEWYIIYHRFKEACDEFEIEISEDFYSYTFLDDDGNPLLLADTKGSKSNS